MNWRWFASLNRQNDDYASQIAEHYEIAGENLQAAHYFYRSGERALRLSAYTEAMAFFERAVQLAVGKVEFEARQLLVKLNIQIGGIWEEQGFYLEAEKLLLDTLLQARSLGEKNLIMETLIPLAVVTYRLGKEDTQYIDEALDLSRELHDIRGEVLAIMWRASYLIISGKYDDTYKIVQSALKLATSIKEQALTARIHNILGESLRYQKKFKEAIVHYQEALPMYRSLNNLYGICLVTTNLGHAYVGAKDLHSSIESYREALSVATKLDSEFNNSIQEVFAGLSGWAADSGDSQLSLELLALLNSHAIEAHETRQIIEASLEKLHEIMDKAVIEDSLSRTKFLDWSLLVEKILTEA
jgi:tetratricopeptide (TPR) repeat protein